MWRHSAAGGVIICNTGAGARPTRVMGLQGVELILCRMMVGEVQFAVCFRLKHL